MRWRATQLSERKQNLAPNSHSKSFKVIQFEIPEKPDSLISKVSEEITMLLNFCWPQVSRYGPQGPVAWNPRICESTNICSTLPSVPLAVYWYHIHTYAYIHIHIHIHAHISTCVLSWASSEVHIIPHTADMRKAIERLSVDEIFTWFLLRLSPSTPLFLYFISLSNE